MTILEVPSSFVAFTSTLTLTLVADVLTPEQQAEHYAASADIIHGLRDKRVAGWKLKTAEIIERAIEQENNE